LRMQALAVLPSVLTRQNYQQFLPVLDKMLRDRDTLAAPYIAYLGQAIRQFDPQAAKRLQLSVTKSYPDNTYIADAAISGLKGREKAFLDELRIGNIDTGVAIHKRLVKVMEDITNKEKNSNVKLLEKELPKGAALFKSTCQTCHGPDGNGIKSLAPALNNSEWVKGNKNKLISIVLFGLTGPVIVNGTLQQPPDINGEMPAMGANPELTDDDIAQVISFIRRAWNNNGDNVGIDDVKKVRERFKGRQKNFTVEELDAVK
jgi:mono/diheme cytochrome c family protein